MNVETAIMPVAGAGTRVFPSTTSIEKCMMPVYAGEQTRPIIDFMVEDCALAGIKRVIFVTTERGQQQLSDYFENINPNLQAQLKRLGKDDIIEEETERRKAFGLSFEYIIQPPTKYGTAYPPYIAREHLEGEDRFALMGGDDFVYRDDGTSELEEAIKLWGAAGTDHVIMGNRVSKAEGPKYGVLQVDDSSALISIDEKPPIEHVPEDPVVNISRYLLSDAIWPYIEEEMSNDRGKGEHHITYPINQALANGQTFQVHPVSGVYMDGGSFSGLLSASLYISEHPKISR